MGTLSPRRVRRARRHGWSCLNGPLLIGEPLESRVLLSSGNGSDPFEQHFDFGTPSSPVALGYTQVAPGTVYSAGTGFGWSQGTIDSRDRGAGYGDERVRDFNFTVDGTFVVDVPRGVYSVTLTMGDGLALRDEMGVFLEGTLVDSVTALASQYETRSFEVTVTDGQLTLTLEDLGGANTLVMINSLNLVQIGGDPSGPQVVNVNPEQEAVGSLERIILTFNKHLDSDTFTTADVSLSGPDGPITPTAVTALFGDMYEILFDTQTTLGEYSLTLAPDVADLEGHLLNQDGDDVNGEPVEDAFSVTVSLVAEPTFEQLFDFGTSFSPVGAGAARVSESTVYLATAGFGWINGSLASRDRGGLSGDDLTRDFNITTAATFVLDVPEAAAIYDVTVTLGDSAAARDEMGLFFEDTLMETVTTAYGTYETRTFQVTVADGQMTLRLEDLGGTDTVAVINSLHVRHAQSVDPPDPEPPDEDPHDGYPEFVEAVRKNRRHWLPAVASPHAFAPPGHTGDTVHDDSNSARRVAPGGPN